MFRVCSVSCGLELRTDHAGDFRGRGYRGTGAALEVLLGHPGGPLWARKDLGAWMIPKGLINPGEAPESAARREFREETGLECPPLGVSLSPLIQKGGKRVLCWTAQADLDLAGFAPGQFEMEWPPRSGRRQAYPEIDQLAYFSAEDGLAKILPSQAPLLRELQALAPG